MAKANGDAKMDVIELNRLQRAWERGIISGDEVLALHGDKMTPEQRANWEHQSQFDKDN